MITAAVIAAIIAITITAIAFGFSLVFLVVGNSLVALCGGCEGKTVVGAVARLISALVECKSVSVATSVETEAEPSLTVPASLSIDDESLTSVAPSTRQNFSPSSL